MKNKYIKIMLGLALASSLVLGGCTGATGTAGEDVTTDEAKADSSDEEAKSVSDTKTDEDDSDDADEEDKDDKESSEDEDDKDDKDDSEDEEVKKDDKESSDKVEATEDAVIEDGWIGTVLYDLSYATPGYYNMQIDEISDHSERGSYYERAYDIGEGDPGSLGIHMYAYKKNSGITEETSYTDAESRTKDYADQTFETVTIPSLAAKVYRASTVNENSYLPYTYHYIFEKSKDDPYIYEIFFNDRFEESAIRLSFEKSLSFEEGN